MRGLCKCRKEWVQDNLRYTTVRDPGQFSVLQINLISRATLNICTCQEKNEEPQKESILAPRTECDHIVGFLSNNQDGGAAPIHQSDSMAKVLEASELLKYCPECGEKVNWAVIERSLNLKKDE